MDIYTTYTFDMLEALPLEQYEALIDYIDNGHDYE